ncbi:thioesterase family protein [Nocardioides yefusunii]|uniref:Thioesterase family protein n=1 Tax=Nocardioides yefusunii TaxID=2500546 RepID=A0ABW1QU96_9ACTN|nr:thioesterase family protein [Nocardioides yefusunii]
MTTPDASWCYRRTSSEHIDGAQGGDDVELFEASTRTSSAWGPHMQHGGPVTGLLVRALEHAGDPTGRRISRVTTELFGMVPVGTVRVTGRVVRPGRRVELLESTMEAPDGDGWKLVATARAWRYRVADTTDVARPADPARDLPASDAARLSEHPLSFAWWEGGFVDALRWKLDADQQSGAATLAWGRLDVALVEGEETTPLQAMVSFADTANGVGARLDPAQFTFLNTEMTLHLFAPPSGEWFGIEAESSVGPDGAGMSAGVLHSPHGPIGRVTQALLVERR